MATETFSAVTWRVRLVLAAAVALIAGALVMLPSEAAPSGGLRIAPQSGTASTPVTLTTTDGCPSTAPYARPSLLDFATFDEVELGAPVPVSGLPKAGDGFSMTVGTWAQHAVSGISMTRTWDVWVDCVTAQGQYPDGDLIGYYASVVIEGDGDWTAYDLDIAPVALNDVAGSSRQTTNFTTGACPTGDAHASLYGVLLRAPVALSSAQGTTFRALGKERVRGVRAAANELVVFDDGTPLTQLPAAGSGYAVTMPDSWDGLADELGDALPLDGLLLLTFECMQSPTFSPTAPFRQAYVAVLEFRAGQDGHSTFSAWDPLTGEELSEPNPPEGPTPTPEGPTPTPTPDAPTPTPTVVPGTPTPTPAVPTPTPTMTPVPGTRTPSATYAAACRPDAPTPAGFRLTRGTAGDDVLVGTSGRDLIRGLGGDDILVGLDGDDVLCGGLGDDLLTGGGGDDLVRGEQGKDSAYGGAGADAVDGGAQADLVNGGLGNDVVVGGTGDDVLHGNAGDDRLFGDGGDDRIYGDDGFDRLFGGPGRDVLVPAGRAV